MIQTGWEEGVANWVFASVSLCVCMWMYVGVCGCMWVSVCSGDPGLWVRMWQNER